MLFASLTTQWRFCFTVPIGLDYAVLYRKMDRMSLTPEEYDELESDIRIMEDEALDTMREHNG